MVAEALARVERDQHGARSVVGPEHDRRTAPSGGVDLA
jgi:hypothetical protein